MAGYRASVTTRAWKQHTCVGCGCAYRYLLTRTTDERGGTQAQALAAARASADRSLIAAVDPHPCPQCGILQPDMLGQAQASTHGRITGLSLLAVLAALALWWFSLASRTWLPWLGAAAGLGLAVLHWRAATRLRNADLAANLERARKETAARTVVVDTPGRSGGPRGVPGASGLSRPQKVALATLLLAAAAISSSEFVRVLGGEPANADWYPPVVGPGDTARIHFPKFVIYAINSDWRGTPSVRVVNAAELGLQDSRLPATSANSEWGGALTATRSGQGAKPTLWIDVAVPARPELAGKTMDLAMTLDVSYPEAAGATYQNAQRSFKPKARLQLGPPLAGRRYRALAFGGMLGGAVAIVFAGGLLTADQLGRQGLPTKLIAAS
jgi:hypothetical protein